jgi:hypothetical protein
MSLRVTNEGFVSVPSNEVNSRQGDDGEQLTVAELLRREGVTQELPVVKDPVDDAPTDRIPVAELLRREGRWDKRKAGKVGVIAAGVAALAGIAVTALSTGQLHDTAASANGGAGGGPYVPPEAKTSQLSSPPSLASIDTTTPDGTSIGKVATSEVNTGAAASDGTRSATGQSSSGGTQAGSGAAGQAPVAAQPTPDSPGAPGSTTTTTRSDPAPTDSSTTTSKPHQPAAHSTTQPTSTEQPTTSTEQPSGGGLLGGVIGLLGGVLGG